MGLARAEQPKRKADAEYGLVDAKIFAGPGEKQAGSVEDRLVRGTPAAEFVAAFAPLAGAINRAKSLTIFEGHPRALDRVKAAGERTRKPSFERHGEWFYSAPLPAPVELDRALRTAVLDGAKPFRGTKLCGGFHADFLLSWEGPAGKVEALLCFGCHELKIVGVAGALYGDLANVEQLRQVLRTAFGDAAAPLTK